jgi:hypothetical protein
MKSLVFGAALLGLALFSENGHAAQLELAVRLGYQLATGKLAEVPPGSTTSAESFDLGESVAGQVPLGFEIGIRIVPMLALGGYVEFAPGILSSEASDFCDAANHDCTTAGFHIGVMGHLHLLPEGAVDPWFGVGVGAEGLAFAESVGSNTLTSSFGGIEYPLRAGVDFRLDERLFLGPYVGYTFGTFSTVAVSCDGPDCSFSEAEADIEDTAPHGWFGFGVKFTVLAL